MLIVVSEVQVYRAADNECVASIKHKTRVNQAVFCLCGRPVVNEVNEASGNNGSAGQGNGKEKDKEQGKGKGKEQGAVKSNPESADNDEEEEEDEDSSMLYVRVASVCEDKTLSLHNIQGVETARLDMQGLHGRPRDMWACPLTLLSQPPPATGAKQGQSSSSSSSSTAITAAAAAAAAALEGEGDGLVVASSQSRLVVLSCRAVQVTQHTH